MKSSRVDEFFQYLSQDVDKKSIEAYYVNTYEDINENQEVINSIRNADQVVILGIPTKTEHNSEKDNWLKFVELDELRALAKTETKWYYAAVLDSIDSTDWENMNVNKLEKYSTISGGYSWYCMTHNGRFDAANDLGVEGESVNPTLLAGYGLGVYLQYKLYGNHCTNYTYSEIVSKMEDTNVAMEDRSKDIEEVRRLITGEKTIIEDTNMINVINATEDESDSQKGEFPEKHYSVFDVMCAGEDGIWSLEKAENGDPIVYTCGNVDNLMEDPFMRFFERTWEEDHWEKNNYKETMDMSKVVTMYNNYCTKKDLSGNWYASAEDVEDEKIYLCTFDLNRKFIKKICLSDILGTLCYDFDLLDKNQIIVPTYSYYGQTMDENKDPQYKYIYIDGISLIDIDTEKITRRYDVGFPLHQIKVSDGKIFGLDYTNEWLIIVNQESGEVEKSIFIGDLGFVKEETDERMWSDRKNLYDISEDKVYFLKKSGIYVININDGKCSKILEGGKLDFFNKPEMYATDFLVKNNNEMYILAVNVDEECATDFYQYSK
ncbi:YncE family protein [Anaerosporobacter sp.]